MESEIKEKLNRVGENWAHLILKYKYFNKKLKLTDDLKKSNYLGDILDYFRDTIEIIHAKEKSKSYTDIFAYQISLLQAIYIQQDFIEELLRIFKCNINKGDLKKDDDYSINREVRNELIGHPICTTKDPKEQAKEVICKSCGKNINESPKKTILLSSTLFSSESSSTNIQYLRYHMKKNYQPEVLNYKICEIINRHNDFLNRYLDIILDKLKRIITEFKSNLEGFEKIIKHQNFEAIIKSVDAEFESILYSSYFYDKDSLIEIYRRRSEHERYQNLIDQFLSDLKKEILEKKEYINELVEPKKIYTNMTLSTIEISDNINEDANKTYNYELGKLVERRNKPDFDFYSSFLIPKCSENRLVLDELKHMEANISNKIEYYTALNLIYKELGE
ncbi:hypothetical protein [uncultured Bacteroides sp.]|uniref:hypothetical protein n=1 Tax=uncultured Bacteroides sp. TaxID=162156 RepID=UPI002AAAB867|nr:hypothetical protein [uncultured Bacteroides sp.]